MGDPDTVLRPWAYPRDRPVVFGAVTYVGERLVCHFCGRDYLNLAGHVWWMHGLTADGYRQEWNLPKHVRLVADPTLRKVAHATRTNGGADRIRRLTTTHFSAGVQSENQALGTIAAAEAARGHRGKSRRGGIYATAHDVLDAWTNDDAAGLGRAMARLKEIIYPAPKPGHRQPR